MTMDYGVYEQQKKMTISLCIVYHTPNAKLVFKLCKIVAIVLFFWLFDERKKIKIEVFLTKL